MPDESTLSCPEEVTGSPAHFGNNIPILVEFY